MNKKCSITLNVCSLLAVFALAGCYEPTAYPELVTPPLVPLTPLSTMLQVPPSPKVPTFVIPGQYRIVGTSVQRLPILSFVLGQGSDVTFILATIHGNESAGTPLVRRLGKYLQRQPHLMAGRTVVLLAVANPDGMARNSRFNANGVDLNRNFPASNRVNDKQSGPTALSEPEARLVKQLIEQYSPDRIVSIHQPLACIDYDGPGTTLAVRMAQYCNLRVKRLGPKPGSLGSYVGVDLGIPIITFEMLQDDSGLDSDTLWRRYGRALIAAIIYPDPVK
jgi:protein MpaA